MCYLLYAIWAFVSVKYHSVTCVKRESVKKKYESSLLFITLWQKQHLRKIWLKCKKNFELNFYWTPQSYYIIMGGGLKGNYDNWGKADVNIFLINVRLTDRHLFFMCMCYVQGVASVNMILATSRICKTYLQNPTRLRFSTIHAKAEWNGDYARRMRRISCAHNNKENIRA